MLKNSGKPGTFSKENLDEYRKAYTNSGGLVGMINWYRPPAPETIAQRPSHFQPLTLTLGVD